MAISRSAVLIKAKSLTSSSWNVGYSSIESVLAVEAVESLSSVEAGESGEFALTSLLLRTSGPASAASR